LAFGYSSNIPIAWLFDINYAAVSKAIGRFEKKIEEGRKAHGNSFIASVFLRLLR